jgi:hypothetical protein
MMTLTYRQTSLAECLSAYYVEDLPSQTIETVNEERRRPAPKLEPMQCAVRSRFLNKLDFTDPISEKLISSVTRKAKLLNEPPNL